MKRYLLMMFKNVRYIFWKFREYLVFSWMKIANDFLKVCKNKGNVNHGVCKKKSCYFLKEISTTESVYILVPSSDDNGVGLQPKNPPENICVHTYEKKNCNRFKKKAPIAARLFHSPSMPNATFHSCFE